MNNIKMMFMVSIMTFYIQGISLTPTKADFQEFANLYKKRPIQHNNGGMRSIGTYDAEQAFQDANKQKFIHEYHTELFAQEPVSTEYTAYTLLKKNPIEGVNYLVIPWAVLINTKQLDKVPSIKLNGGFTVCQHIRYETILPILAAIGIDTLFTPHVKKSQSTKSGINIVPFPHFPVNGIEPAIQKSIWYSFVGVKYTHWTRKEIFSMPVPPNAVIKERKQWHWWGKDQEKEKKEYQDILSRSRFSLCPRGTGASTIRFWESIQAGAIPVVLADEFVLPEEDRWADCLIRIPEKDVRNISTILRAITSEKEIYMRDKCLAMHALFSGENFVRTIRNHYH